VFTQVRPVEISSKLKILIQESSLLWALLETRGARSFVTCCITYVEVHFISVVTRKCAISEFSSLVLFIICYLVQSLSTLNISDIASKFGIQRF
jgi:hypothetical protein